MKRVTEKTVYSSKRARMITIYEVNVTPKVLQNIGKVIMEVANFTQVIPWQPIDLRCVVCKSLHREFVGSSDKTIESTLVLRHSRPTYPPVPCLHLIQTQPIYPPVPCLHLIETQLMPSTSARTRDTPLVCNECVPMEIHKIIPSLKRELRDILRVLPLPIQSEIWEHLSYTEINENLDEVKMWGGEI